MSAFWIFATCLTVAYIIYYSVVVWRDLSKPKEQVSSSEETFELADTAPEPTKVVEQTDKGFCVVNSDGQMKEQESMSAPTPPARTAAWPVTWAGIPLALRNMHGRN